jgi:hypothetical protein
MKLLELFCGTKSVSKYAESIGIETVTLDYQAKFKPDYCMDILHVDEEWLEEFKEKHGPIDIIHASPDCRHYSKVRYNWKALGHPEPDLEYADSLVLKARMIIDYLKPTHWFLENPYTGRLKTRGLLDDVPMKRCCYCKYDTDGTFLTKKETAIWGSVDNWTPRMCDRAHGYCAARAKHGKHLMSIGNSVNVNVGRTARLMMPPLLVEELFCSIGQKGPTSENI